MPSVGCIKNSYAEPSMRWVVYIMAPNKASILGFCWGFSHRAQEFTLLPPATGSELI